MHNRVRKKNVAIVGAGCVGTTLAVMLHEAGYTIGSVVSRHGASAQKLATLVSCKNYSTSVSAIDPKTELLVITVSEDQIIEVASILAKSCNLNFKMLTAFHTSGALTSEELRPLFQKGTSVFSLHPIQSFSKYTSLKKQLTRMKEISYGFEGDTRNYAEARHIVKKLNGKIVRIPKEAKILYHIACVCASNYSVALLGAIDGLLNDISSSISMKDLAPLVRTSIDNALQMSPGKALTGPIARGNISTVQRHLNALRRKKDFRTLYAILGLYTVTLAREKKTLTQKQILVLNQMLRLKG